MDDRASLDGDFQTQNAYQVYHKEGLLSQQSSVAPNAPLLYEQQVLLSKLRHSGGATGHHVAHDKLHRPISTSSSSSPPSPDHMKYAEESHSQEMSSQELDEPKSEVYTLPCIVFMFFFRYINYPMCVEA